MKNSQTAERRRRTLAIRDRAYDIIARHGRQQGKFEHQGIKLVWHSLEKGAWFFDLTKPLFDIDTAPSSLLIRYRAENVFRSVSEGDRMRVPLYVPGDWEDILLARSDQSEESA